MPRDDLTEGQFIDRELLMRADRVLNELHNALEDIDPESEVAELLFGPVNELGYAVDQILAMHKASDTGLTALATGGGRDE